MKIVWRNVAFFCKFPLKTSGLFSIDLQNYCIVIQAALLDTFNSSRFLKNSLKYSSRTVRCSSRTFEDPIGIHVQGHKPGQVAGVVRQNQQANQYSSSISNRSIWKNRQILEKTFGTERLAVIDTMTSAEVKGSSSWLPRLTLLQNLRNLFTVLSICVSHLQGSKTSIFSSFSRFGNCCWIYECTFCHYVQTRYIIRTLSNKMCPVENFAE